MMENSNEQSNSNIYFDPTAASEPTMVPEEKKKGKGKVVIIIIVVIIVLLLLCCCGGAGVWGLYTAMFGSNPIGGGGGGGPYTVDKPVIYLYPEEKTEVTVQVSDPELFTVTYPDYRNGWNVIAEKNGTLTDPDTLKTYYSLYYESELPEFSVMTSEKEGFLVAGDDVQSFLEEKLEVLGLNDREAEEMIIYWLPQMSQNDYNLVRFATREEIDEAMGLSIAPEPDSVIRVWMVWEGVSAEEAAALENELTEQELTTPEREGFTVVEWGGIRK